MNLREQAAADLATIVGDAAAGFGVRISVKDPDGWEGNLIGLTADIGQTIDPETGQTVSGRQASAAFAIADFQNNGMKIPSGIADGSGKPWIAIFADANAVEHTYRIVETMPDRGLGVVTCILETYRE